jgi:hypothetical protein
VRIVKGDAAIERVPGDSIDGPVLLSDPEILFTHERTSSGGLRMLLLVEMHMRRGREVELTTFQIGRLSSGTLAGMIGEVAGSAKQFLLADVPIQSSLRLYSGQFDSEDSAKLYIPFEFGEQRGRICGTFLPHPRTAKFGEVEWRVLLDTPATTRASK